MAKKLTPEVEKRVKEVLKEWNKGWREYYRKGRLGLLFDLPHEAAAFLDEFEVTGSYPIYGIMLYGRCGDQKVTLKLDYNEVGWMIKPAGEKTFQLVQDAWGMDDKQTENFETFMEEYEFTQVFNAIKIAERKDIVDDRRNRYVGTKVVDIIKKGSSFHVVLDNGESFPYGDFLQFRGHLKSVTRK